MMINENPYQNEWLHMVVSILCNYVLENDVSPTITSRHDMIKAVSYEQNSGESFPIKRILLI